MTQNLYDALGVDKDAAPDAIKRAYRKAAKSAHPDAGGDPEAFALVCLAKDVLSDAERRAKYDRTGKYEDVGPDQTESSAMQIVMQSITFVLQQITIKGRRVETFDIVGDATKKIKGDMAQMREQKRNHEAEAKAHRKLAKRFRAKKGKQNRISVMFENMAAMHDQQGAAAVQHVPAHEMALAILADHSFDVEAETQSHYNAPALGQGFFGRLG